MSKIKIIIADSHTLTREGVKSLLSRRKDLQIAGEALNSDDLKEKMLKIEPQIVILDFHIPGYFSIDDVAVIRKKFPKTSLLVITSNQHKKDVLKVLEYGVSGYLLKECDEEEILSAVYAAARQEKFFCGRVMDSILEKVMHQCPIGSICDHCQAVSLSEREIEIIRLIADGYTTLKIADKLFLSFHTVSTHRKNIFKKLSIRSSSELIRYALKKGIIVPEE